MKKFGLALSMLMSVSICSQGNGLNPYTSDELYQAFKSGSPEAFQAAREIESKSEREAYWHVMDVAKAYQDKDGMHEARKLLMKTYEHKSKDDVSWFVKKGLLATAPAGIAYVLTRFVK